MKSISLTPKQLEILTLLYRFRFLNRYQIQKFLGHKSPQRTNAWLNDMTKKSLVGRIYSNKFPENTKPAIYYLDTKARQVLEKVEDVNKGKKILNSKGNSGSGTKRSRIVVVYTHLCRHRYVLGNNQSSVSFLSQKSFLK